MNKKLLTTVFCMLAICVAAQNIVKKCKECGKPIASCQYKGKHPTKPVHLPNSGNNSQTVHPDYSQLNIGDYFYSDGTVSRVKKNAPQPVGVVFSLTPSDNDKKRGWTHGYIMALSDAKKGRCEWGPYKNIEEIDDYDMCNTDRSDIVIKDYNGYDYCNSKSIISTQKNAFYYARNYSPKLPDHTSGWFLPSTGHWCSIIENLGGGMVEFTKRGVCNYIGFNPNIVIPNIAKFGLGTDDDYCTYWTANEASREEAWFVILNYSNDGMNFYTNTKKTTRMRVRAIAAF